MKVVYICCTDCRHNHMLTEEQYVLRAAGLWPYRCRNCGLRPAMKIEHGVFIRTYMEETA